MKQLNIRVKEFYATTLMSFTNTGPQSEQIQTKITVTFVQEKYHNAGTRSEACSAVVNL